MKTEKKGFTLLEILLVVAAIAILAGIVIIAINPTKQLGDTRNAQRWSDVNAILNAVYQYSIDNNGSLPNGTEITTTSTEICISDGVAVCNQADPVIDLVNLSALLTNETYLVSLPVDPSGNAATGGIGYEIKKTGNNRITVSAPDAEGGITISVSK